MSRTRPATTKSAAAIRSRMAWPTLLLSTSAIRPRSTDELWIDSPKFVPGQEGVWLLHRDQQERGAAAMRVSGALTALDPIDFQPRDRLEQVRSLLGGDESPTP